MKNLLIIFYCILLCTCPTDPFLEKKYPSDIVIHGEGTLKYIRTFWDKPHNKKNKGGTEIYDARLIDNIIWILGDYHGDDGHTLYRGINRSATVNIQKVGKSYPYTVYSRILHAGIFFIFYVQKDNTNYIARINKTTLKRQFIEMPDIFDDFPYRFRFYNDNENLILLYNENYFSPKPTIYTYWKINENCDDFTEITEQEFNDLYTTPPDFVTDATGRYYRFYKGDSSKSERGYIEVSLDNGDTWHYGDMGTNRPVNIIIQNDSIYVFCNRYSAGSALSREYVGGGIHEFKWQ